MQIFALKFAKCISSLILVIAISGNADGDTILEMGTVSVMQASGGGGLGGTSTFTLSADDIPDLELLTNFSIVDAGVEIRVNGTSLFPLFDDISQFSQDLVFLDTGVTLSGGNGEGNIESPFSPNNNGLPRLTVNSTSDGTTFGGGALVNDSSVTDYTPNFTVQDFTSLLVAGENNIEFFVLNSFEGANLQGDFTVSLNPETVAVPEPTVTGFALFVLATGLTRRRRRPANIEVPQL